MKILILSDLHAYTPSPKITRAPSFLVNSHMSSLGMPDMLTPIPELLDEEGLDVDWIICPGDIADKAEPTAQEFAWRSLCELKKKTRARLLLATAGNHDVDSRLKYNDFDPKSSLQALLPPFPGIDDKTSDTYWSRNFHIYTEGPVRLLNLNSSAFHGYHSEEVADTSKSEYRHGRISEYTIQRIENALQGGNYPVNILLTHHHPFPNDKIYDSDYSSMIFGSRLVDRISQVTSSSWLIIHGHQHLPEVSYGPGKAHVPVVFSAGSFSASIEAPYASIAPNQFYHLTLATDSADTKNWSPCGVVRAWHWELRHKWQRSPLTFSIPYGSGFGCRAQPSVLAHQIASEVNGSPDPLLEGKHLFSKIPELRYLLQDSLHEVLKLLPKLGVVCTIAPVASDSIFRRA
ncbi:hypothetical protein CK228_12840 [Mesorhizobium sp. WSM4312]|uniref:metallophosphoesterase family protein n=1 Tax=Mesorhizobium sp. WSM4312 TaxID=2029411 RepID=UPI000BAF9717|nr:metallophosphoesterase [Mesorhizobium sp. WSM4312]PBB68015.1 hypothetical protein CK228_12840 [Mesorhizobium sp. WSM4312]